VSPACTELELAETETVIGEDALTDELPPPPQAVIAITKASDTSARPNHAAGFIPTSRKLNLAIAATPCSAGK